MMLLVVRVIGVIGLGALAVASATAAENNSFISQTGSDNDGLVVQIGNRNDVGSENDAAGQTGDRNAIVLKQTGDDNGIGTEGSGFAQSSNRNTATITQIADDNVVGQVSQTGIGSSAGGVALRRNVLTITQDSTAKADGNRIASVSQTRSASPLATGQAANTATLIQTGGGNLIGSASGTSAGVVQSGYGQSAIITQTGDGNVVTSTAQTGSRNRLELTFIGNNNGTLAFAAANAPAGAWGNLTQGRVRQSNDFFGAGLLTANDLVFHVTGDHNSFGFDQQGSDNAIAGTVNGNGNQTGAIQLGAINDVIFTVDGDENQLFIHQGLWAINNGNTANAVFTGDENIVALRQSGSANEGAVAITGNENRVNLSQESVLLGNEASITIGGDLNDVTLIQSLANEADISIDGDNNFLAASQTGLNNTLSIDIDGNNTNRGFFTVGKPAALSAGALLPGTVVQTGIGNAIDYEIGPDSGLSGDGNLFALSQVGNGNGIDGLTLGDNNEVAIIQSGNNNYTAFMQVGSGNIIGVMQ